MQDFTKLKVWQKSHTFTVNLYKTTQAFPKHELYGLTNQLRRASASVESNIAEGCGRESNKELSRFIVISQGSSYEVRCQLYIARDLGYIKLNQFSLLNGKIVEISKMLNSFNQKLITND